MQALRFRTLVGMTWEYWNCNTNNNNNNIDKVPEIVSFRQSDLHNHYA